MSPTHVQLARDDTAVYRFSPDPLAVGVALFLLNYEIGASKGSELHESVVCRYILSTSSLLGLVPQETTFVLSSVDSYSAHPLVNLEKNLFHILGGTLDE